MSDTPAAAQAATSATPQANAPITVVPNGGASGTPASDWTTGFDDGMKGFIQNKGFKNPSDLASAYQNLEKFHGVPADRMIKLPENMDTPEGRAVWERLGAPKDPKEYNLPMPKENADPKMAEVFSQKFAELGVPKSMAEKITNTWNEYIQGSQAARNENAKVMLVQEQTALKKEWGAAHDQNVQIGREAAKKFGFDEATLSKIEGGMGYQGLMKLMHRLGTAVGEHNYISGNRSEGFGDAMAPTQAKSKMDSLLGDPTFKARYLSGDKAALDQMTKLSAMAAPGDFSV